ILGVSSPENGKWHGPFRSLSAAKSVVPRVIAEIHVCAQDQHGVMQHAESYADRHIEPEPDEILQSNKTLAILLRAIESTDLAGDARGSPPRIAEPDRPAHSELLKSIATIPATLGVPILPHAAPARHSETYVGPRIG